MVAQFERNSFQICVNRGFYTVDTVLDPKKEMGMTQPQQGIAKVITYIAVAALVLVGCAPTTAVTPVLADRGAFVQDYTVDAGPEATFDAVLRVGQQLNLSVQSADRDTGIIQFSPATVDAQQLDSFAYYPLIHPLTGYEWSSFSDWNARAGGQVFGEVAYTVLITRAAKGTNLNIRTNWVASGPDESFVVNSRGISERDFVQQVRSIAEL